MLALFLGGDEVARYLLQFVAARFPIILQYSAPNITTRLGDKAGTAKTGTAKKDHFADRTPSYESERRNVLL